MSFDARPATLTGAAFATALFLLASSPGLAIGVAPPMGTATDYALLGTNSVATVGTVTCTDTGPGGNVDGNVGSSFTSITNNGCVITGSIDAPVAGSVIADFQAAYAALGALNPTCDGVIPTTSTVLPPGVYCSTAGTTVGAGVIFTLSGTAADVWIFKVGTSGLGALTGNSFQVVMGGSAQACNVFWWTAEAATMTDSNFIGTILAGSAISLSRGDFLGRAQASTDVTSTDEAPFTFAGCAPLSTIIVEKDFVPDTSGSVSVELACTSGVVEASPLLASEGAPALFSVSGATVGATCTATETVPAGYAADQTDCAAVPLDGGCTLVNTLLGNAITVNKDFLPNSPASVSVDLVCSSGTVDITPLDASESAPAVFTVSGASVGTTCTATETVPAGYTADETSCQSVSLGGSCTILNSLDAIVVIPALSTWGTTLLVSFLALAGMAALRRRAI
jgi:hypothetical protein